MIVFFDDAESGVSVRMRKACFPLRAYAGSPGFHAGWCRDSGAVTKSLDGAHTYEDCMIGGRHG
jgi:hypothetical protein